MRSKTWVFVSLLLASLFSTAQLRLSDRAEIAIMTLGPYQPELYSAFGHTAIRVHDPASNFDRVFNYGVFDFDQENFYLNFAKGKMVYQLGMSYYEPFRDFYISEDRYVKEQYLNLTQAETQAFFDFLANNYKPENREYFYNYVYDNCATKIPEVVETVFPGQIKYDTSFMEKGKTVRDLMHDYLDYQPWGTWMIDIGLGMQIDSEADRNEFMFLPDYVFKAFENAKIVTNGTSKPLVKRTEILHTPVNPPEENGWLTPMNFFILLFFVGGWITHLNMKKGKRTKWLDTILFGFAGFVGIWLLFIWFGTAHLSKSNLDILWAVPLHFPIIFLMRKKSLRKWIRLYFKYTAIWYGALLIAWAMLPEPLHMALVPFTLLLLLRSAYISYEMKRS